MKEYWRVEVRIAPRILDLGIGWRWVVSFTPLPLYPQGKSPWYPLDRRLGEPQKLSGRGGIEKNSQLLSGLEPPVIQVVAQRYTTELSRLLIRGTRLIKKPQCWQVPTRTHFKFSIKKKRHPNFIIPYVIKYAFKQADVLGYELDDRGSIPDRGR
jgi:hypothetical protein